MAEQTFQPLVSGDDYARVVGSGTYKVNNIMAGGQLGLGPRLAEIDASTPLAFPNAIIQVLHLPVMFDVVPVMKKLVKNLIEDKAKSITGLDITTTLDTAEGYVLQDGQPVEVPVGTKRPAVSPSVVFPEYQGNIVFNTFDTWINMINHADTQYSAYANYAIEAGVDPSTIDPHVFKDISMSILVIQPDVTLLPQNIIDAFIVMNMIPKEVSMTIKREIGGSHEVGERTIPFTGVLQRNNNTKQVGKLVLEALKLHQANFDFAKPAFRDGYDKVLNLEEGTRKEIQSILDEFKLVETI